jgi:hypothetical protein
MTPQVLMKDLQMATETISIVTYLVPDPPRSLEDGSKKAISTAPTWGDKTGIAGIIPTEQIRGKDLIRIDLPVETLERELQDLVRVMNRVFSQAEPVPATESTTNPLLVETSPKKKLHLTEISVAVEINATGRLSILGSGGELGGKGGITLKFVKE